jgi:molybdopterin-containing oxidoreductase family iron-sulfur binding subunit
MSTIAVGVKGVLAVSSTGEWLPSISDAGTNKLDAMADAEQTNPREVLEKADYDTELGLAMTEDAQRVSRGELSSDEAPTEVVRGDA